LAAITGAARRLSGDNLHERLAFDGPDDELKELADTFDGMLGRLHAAFESQRRFVANASHELRTPLAIMRTELEVTLSDPATGEHELRRMAAVLSGAVDRSDQLIGHLLVLARSQRGLEALEPIDLADLVADAVGRHQAAGIRAGLKVATSLEPASLGGDRGLLEQLVTNLVDNAVKHNRPGGWIDVAVATIGSEVILTVVSSGFEVPPEAVDRLWEPFRRLTSDRLASPAGSGLGLSIVQAVATAHGGEAGAEPVEGGGLRVTVRLPAAPVLAALACPV
jgi:signal transduction histidine kinase